MFCLILLRLLLIRAVTHLIFKLSAQVYYQIRNRIRYGSKLGKLLNTIMAESKMFILNAKI